MTISSTGPLKQALILLNYYPNIFRGRDDVFALMFDMNDL